MNIFQAISVAHTEKDKKVETKTVGRITVWADGAWESFREYTKAVDYVYDFNYYLFTFLKWIGYI